MTDQTPRHALPYVMPAQAQKHVTVNEALMRLDGIVQLALEALSASSPPPEPAPGASWAAGPDPQGAWAGHGGEIATWHPEGWRFAIPRAGFIAWDKSAARAVVHDGAGWIPLSAAADALDRLGVNTPADATNRLAVKSDAVLFSHDDVTPGSGDVRFVVNKAGPENAGEVLFQTGWSGRAAFGVAGDDRFRIKVSADGAAFAEVLTAGAGESAAFGSPVAPPAFPGDGAPAPAAHPGALIWLTTGENAPCLAVSDGSAWRRLRHD